MKLLISGSRDWNWYGVFKKAMIDSLSELQNMYVFRRHQIEVVEGGAWGVDYMARRFAKEMKFPTKSFPANWDSLNSSSEKVSIGYNPNTGHNYNKMAGHNRNIRMMDYINPHPLKALVAFQMDKSKGTQSMIDIALKAGIPVYHFEVSSKKEDRLFLKTYNLNSIWVNRYR